MNKKIISLLAVFCFSVAGVYAAAPEPIEPIQPAEGEQFIYPMDWGFTLASITSKEIFSKENKDKVFIVLVGFSKCTYCQAAEKFVFARLIERYAQDKQVLVVKLNALADKVLAEKARKENKTDENHVVTKFEISRWPTMLVMRDGEEFWSQKGFAEAEADTVITDITKAVDEIKVDEE